ncbi:CELL DIVISION PROTEIN KINASE [Salix koriyanagi]|uniref:CELL DIVISION PROTEIN KINASE n=1 Tax=Salix koriyanagi TaxID=2511006 RepID=A0A9Q0VR97_9ROSI|nr:CELL DIVISION PROTEIN KINASE [Salix koriyanagi]
MGCIYSKRAVSVVAATPANLQPPYSAAVFDLDSANPSGSLDFEQNQYSKDKKDKGYNICRKNSLSYKDGGHNEGGLIYEDQQRHHHHHQSSNHGNNKRLRKRRSSGSGSISFKLGFSSRNVAVEQIAAGWPSWLSAAAGEAVHGWVPLRAEAFEKLDKIGQGTYSSVFQARDVETGRMVALKKVRFDNFKPESIRFMAREIMILRRLDHPNIMKLEGIITSRMSSSIYLVFEYMEHDLSGLLSSPDVKFTESQVKCYMKQLLCGIEHFHSLGDFGLANVLNSRNQNQLTSRVVTLWYRPPELLMGSTSYGVSVDLWSVGCVFGEILFGKPLLKGRTEVEQLHKIFKLCGSPSDDFWKRSKLSNATMFKPQHPYESSLQERCKDIPATAVDLMETLLSIEPVKRGTASSALLSQYFRTMPYACDPSSLPKYPPNKEMDAKYREEARRKKAGGRIRDPGLPRKPRRVHRTFQEQNFNKFAPKEELKDNSEFVRLANDNNAYMNGREGVIIRGQNLFSDTISETGHATKGHYSFTGPAPVTASSGFAWAKTLKEDSTSTVSYDPSVSSSQISAVDSSRFNFANSSFDFTDSENGKKNFPEASAKRVMQKQHNQSEPFDSLDASEDHSKEREKIEFSGPLLFRPNKIEELLQRNESQIRRAARRTRLATEM